MPSTTSARSFARSSRTTPCRWLSNAIGATRQTVIATLGTNNDANSPHKGSALLGVGSYGAQESEQMSVASAARRGITDLFPSAWESTKGIVQVLNPVNIIST